MIKVLLADDHAVLREGIAQVLADDDSIEVIAQASDGQEAIDKAIKHHPDVALVDINMPKKNGVQVTLELQTLLPKTAILILTMYKHEKYIIDAIRAGANGYILKEAALADLVAAIKSVANGEAVIDPSITEKLLNELRPQKKIEVPPIFKVTNTDKAILTLVAKGSSNKEIANELNMAEKTIRNRMSLMYKKLKIKNRAEAAVLAVEQGWTELDDLN